MKRLLEIEFIKLFNNRASRILIIAYFILLTSIALIAAIKFDIGPIEFHLAKEGIFNFPYIWHFNAYIVAFFKLFLAIVIVAMVANEYSNKTLKQNLIDGLSKKEFIASKFLTVLLFAGVSTVFLFVLSLILGGFYSDYTELSIVFRDLEYLVAFFLKLTAFFSFCLFLGLLIKRSAFALGFLALWSFFERLFGWLLYWQLPEGWSENIMQFFPLRSMSNLIEEPFTRLSAVKNLASQLGENFSGDYGVHFGSMLIVIFWIAFFIYFSWYLLKKRDL